MFQRVRNAGLKLAALVGAVAAPVVSFAQAATVPVFDATSYGTVIAGTAAGMLVIGGAVFGLNVAIKSTKWARKAL